MFALVVEVDELKILNGFSLDEGEDVLKKYRNNGIVKWNGEELKPKNVSLIKWIDGHVYPNK